MKVYLVIFDNNTVCFVDEVFSSQESANKYINDKETEECYKQNSYVEEMEVLD